MLGVGAAGSTPRTGPFSMPIETSSDRQRGRPGLSPIKTSFLWLQGLPKWFEVLVAVFWSSFTRCFCVSGKRRKSIVNERITPSRKQTLGVFDWESTVFDEQPIPSTHQFHAPASAEIQQQTDKILSFLLFAPWTIPLLCRTGEYNNSCVRLPQSRSCKWGSLNRTLIYLLLLKVPSLERQLKLCPFY